MRLFWLTASALLLLGCDGGSSNPPADGNATAAATSQSAPQAASAASIERVTSVEGITEYRLDNGLQILLFPDPSSSTVTVNMTYLVGSVDEGQGETGMAHLLEHMLFLGTPSHPDPSRELRDRGASYNGSTSWERTNYFETLEGTTENLDWALEFEADRMINAHVAQDNLDSEMTVVRNEFERGENSPVNVLYQRVLSTAYLWHGYGNSPIGSRSDIENVPIERLRAFYERHYQPDNAVLVVAGRIDEAETLELIAEHFGPIPRPERDLLETYTVEPVQDGERQVLLSRVGDLPTVIIGFHAPDGAHEDFVPLQVAARALSDTPSGRLYRALVEPGLAAQVGSDELQLKDPGMVLFFAMLPPDGDVNEVREIINSVIDDIETNPITDEEVERMRNQALSSIEQLMNNSQRVALQLSEWASSGDWRLFFLDRDRVRQVTAAQAQAAALKYFKPSNRTVGLYTPTESPDRAIIPEKPDLTALLDGYTGDGERSAGEAFDPSPENIDARTIVQQLPGGIEVALLPKETRGDRVTAAITLNFGTLESVYGLDTVGSLTGRMLMRGTQSRSRQEIQDEIDRLQSRLNVSGSVDGASASIQSTRENLPAVLELAFEVLTQPAFPESELTILRDSAIASIESQRNEPDAILAQEISRYYRQNYERGDPRYRATFDEQIEELNAVDVDDLRAFHQNFYGASNAQAVAVGDFDPDQFTAAIEAALGDWSSPGEYEEITDPYPDPVPPPVNRSFDTPDKENAFFRAFKPIQMTDEHADYPAMVLGNYILGSGLSSRLGNRIRTEEGLSYSVGSGFAAPSNSDGAQFNAQAIAAPQNVPQVEASFLDELGQVLTDGYTAEEVESAKGAWLQSRQVSRSQDGAIVGMLGANLRDDRTMAFAAELEARVAALTPAEIREAMNRHLDVDSLIIMKAGDFQE
ncbi:MAG: pitrilysin family protein [Gammaproteobacteria bacterium]|jgi:zinc protease